MHVPRGAPEPHDADADSSSDKAHKRFQQEMGELESRDCVTLRFLQLLPDTQNDPMHPGNGSWLSMACNCDVNFKRDFYGEIKLWTGLQNGIAAGAGTVLPVVKVVVCDSCGT